MFRGPLTRPPLPLFVCCRRLSSVSASSNHKHYDVIIAGGGAVGSALARLLLDDKQCHRRRLKVALLERRAAPQSLLDLVANNGDNETKTPNARAYALSPTSLSYLGSGPLHALLQSNRCGVYDAMQVWEHDGPAQLHFTGEDLSYAIEDGRLVDLSEFVNSEKEEGMTTTTTTKAKKSNRKRPWLGAVIEDAPLVSSLWDELRNDDRIDLLDNVQINKIRAPSLGEMGNVIPPPPIQLSYTHSSKEKGFGEECTTTISSNLLVAADGANSQVRSLVGTFQMMKYPYDKKAVTCTVEVESSMAHTAYQRFLSHGPIALLPVWNGHSKAKDSPIYANVVWSTTTSEANHLLSLTPSEFISALNLHLRQGPNVNPSLLPESDASHQPSSVPTLFSTIAREFDSLLRTTNTALTMGTWAESPSRNYFRMPPKSIRVVGSIVGFDLSMSHLMMTSSLSSSTKGTYGGGYTSPRVALVGDAAHTMHPMAGQGLNLGMGDVALLSNLIKESIDSGMDVGGTSLFLDRYNRERMVNSMSVVGGVHSLHEIFGVSGTAPGSMADGTYDGGKGNAGSLRSLVGYSRSLGMNVVNGLPFIRRMLAEIAAGATHFKKTT